MRIEINDKIDPFKNSSEVSSKCIRNENTKKTIKAERDEDQELIKPPILSQNSTKPGLNDYPFKIEPPIGHLYTKL